MGYEPKGRTKDLIEAMRAVAEERPIWTKAQCAEVMEIVVSQVPAYLMRALEHKLLHQRTVNGKPEYSLKPFPAEAPAPTLEIPRFVPPPMRVPREGSDRRHVNPPGRPAPLSGEICPGCESLACQERGCVKCVPPSIFVPTFSVAPSPAPTMAPVPTPAATAAPAPTPAPTAPPAPTAAPADAPGLEDAIESDEEVEEPDAWISCRTGSIVITGVEPQEDGSFILPPDLVAHIKRQLAWSPLR